MLSEGVSHLQNEGDEGFTVFVVFFFFCNGLPDKIKIPQEYFQDPANISL